MVWRIRAQDVGYAVLRNINSKTALQKHRHVRLWGEKVLKMVDKMEEGKSGERKEKVRAKGTKEKVKEKMEKKVQKRCRLRR